MTQVFLHTSVPVTVVVDLETGEVDRVIVVDELVKSEYKDPEVNLHDHRGEYGTRQATELEAKRATNIAENSEWPAWEFGW